jgi:hypothetical protein
MRIGEGRTDDAKLGNVETRKAQPEPAVRDECRSTKRVADAEFFNTSNDLACGVSTSRLPSRCDTPGPHSFTDKARLT